MLTEAQERIAAYAVAASHEDAGITVNPEDLPDAEQLRERGWLDRTMDGDEAVYRLSRRGKTALEMNALTTISDADLN